VPATAVSCRTCEKATLVATEPARPAVWPGDSAPPAHAATALSPRRLPHRGLGLTAGFLEQLDLGFVVVDQSCLQQPVAYRVDDDGLYLQAPRARRLEAHRIARHVRAAEAPQQRRAGGTAADRRGIWRCQVSSPSLNSPLRMTCTGIASAQPLPTSTASRNPANRRMDKSRYGGVRRHRRARRSRVRAVRR
jgi:hypothetical protein